MGHEGHHYVQSVVVLDGDSDQLHDVAVVEPRHQETLLHQSIQLTPTERT